MPEDNQPEDPELTALLKAVGPWHWREAWIRISSGKPISRKMTLFMALVTFGGYELFPAMDELNQLKRKPAPEIDLSECYREGGSREFERQDWSPSLRKALTHCHDVNRALIRDMARKDERAAAQELRLGRQWLWIKILSASVVGSWALVVVLVGLLLERR